MDVKNFLVSLCARLWRIEIWASNTLYAHTTHRSSSCSHTYTGCSKSSSPQPHADAPPNTKDLGAVELVAHTPMQFSLGAGKGVTVTGSPLSTGMMVKLVMMTTNANGSVDHSQGQIETLPGQQCAISLGDTMVGLTPTLKTP